MYKIVIVWDSFKHFENAIKEYEKRLWKNCEIIRLKPVKNWTDKQIIEAETKKVLEKIKNISWYKIVLNPQGKNFNTKEFYNFLESKKQNFWNIIFIIWWALGLDYEKIRENTNYEISLWKMTMPHILALLVLIEQLYRVEMIKKWTSYDK